MRDDGRGSRGQHFGGNSFKMSRMSLSDTREKQERGELPEKGVSEGKSREFVSSSFRIEAIFSEKNTLKRSGRLSRGMSRGKTAECPFFPNNSSAI